MVCRWRIEELSLDLYSLLSIQSVPDLVRCGRLRWFRHQVRDDLVSNRRKMKVAGVQL